MSLERNHLQADETDERRRAIQQLDRPEAVAVPVEVPGDPLYEGVALLARLHGREVLHHLRIGVQRGERLEVGLAPFAQQQPFGPQHSMTLTASPPRAVSLYLTFMSAPVSRIVLITLSRLTTCVPSPRSAIRAEWTALTEAIALRSMHGICTRPPTGSQVSPRWCSMPISAAFSTCSGVPPITAARPAAAIEQATPTSPWQPTSAPEIDAFSL